MLRGEHSHFLTQVHEESHSILHQALYHDLSSCSLPTLAKTPLAFSLNLRGICLLQYDVSRHVWPQLSRKPVSQEKGISVLCRALGPPLLGAFVLMPHTKVMPNTTM